jgi:HD-GYP domain-containing protein (c-di-GMP phosphodiesterase class II)
MLQRAGVTDEAWLRYVLEHHERQDGSGYPNSLKGESAPCR